MLFVLLCLPAQAQEHGGDHGRQAIAQGELTEPWKGINPAAGPVSAPFCEEQQEKTARAFQNDLQQATHVLPLIWCKIWVERIQLCHVSLSYMAKPSNRLQHLTWEYSTKDLLISYRATGAEHTSNLIHSYSWRDDDYETVVTQCGPLMESLSVKRYLQASHKTNGTQSFLASVGILLLIWLLLTSHVWAGFGCMQVNSWCRGRRACFCQNAVSELLAIEVLTKYLFFCLKLECNFPGAVLQSVCWP